MAGNSRARWTVTPAVDIAVAQLLLCRLAVTCTGSLRLEWVLALWSGPRWKALYLVAVVVLVVAISQQEVEMALALAQ